jgi:hypothetical protein
MQATEERADYLKELEKVSASTLIIQGRNDLLFQFILPQPFKKLYKMRNWRSLKIVVIPSIWKRHKN